MFGIGMTELLVILVIGLLVLGPKRLPELARSLGRGLAEFRRASTDLRREFLAEDEPRLEPRAGQAAGEAARESGAGGAAAGPEPSAPAEASGGTRGE
jgi:Tat protein translocase TatB subunit